MHNTAKISCELGRYYELPIKELKTLKTAAEFHDIGKSLIKNQHIFSKKRITAEEYDLIKCHTKLGANYLRWAGFSDEVVSVVMYHHERWDGGGYPDGLEKENIPLLSRILAIADTFDALTSKRPYRETVGPFQALKEINKNAGTQFDPELVKMFLKCWTCPEKQKEVMASVF